MCIKTFRSFALSTWVLFISLMQSANGAQFLDITSLFISSTSLAAESAAAGSMYALLDFSNHIIKYNQQFRLLI